MLYREMGQTGEKVSILGFGCMRLPIKVVTTRLTLKDHQSYWIMP